MQTRNRLLALKRWMTETVCQGRTMKSPGPNNHITQFIYREPKVYCGGWPTRPESNYKDEDLSSICPGILIAPNTGFVKNVEDKRFDQYNNIHRPQEFGQWLNVTIGFVIYEPGIRLPGFVTGEGDETVIDTSRLVEGTEEGLFTLMDWIDECKASLLSQKNIPGSDLILDEMSLDYGPYVQSDYISDKRPLFYGFINAKFQCFAEEKNNSSLDQYLD